MAHGGGGRLMQQLIESIFVPTFKNDLLSQRHDGAVFSLAGQRLAFTTDSYVVQPLFFPGGDIGTLAVNGTANDLAMCGARPLYLSSGLIIEEGLPMETLWRIVQSMKQAADKAGVQLVTGDTKVVDKGKGDGIFINTAGVGVIEHNLPIGPGSVRPGDAVLLSGDIGRHGITIMSVRDGLGFETSIESDCAPLWSLVAALIDQGIEIHCLRDLTRGGLASGLNEIAQAANLPIAIDETAVPVREEVRGACEILGFDPIYVANEGRFIAFVPANQADRALGILRANPLGADASHIGTVAATTETRPIVTLKSQIGANRILDLLSGEQLPRIC
ncbi:MAG: hydrogenase expression/formation protein HypE [Methylacidiphilales bacterium]|nr:hydrogenase expression/formation protein HypE [Candidatus Methylacidiphilales bacterium]